MKSAGLAAIIVHEPSERPTAGKTSGNPGEVTLSVESDEVHSDNSRVVGEGERVCHLTGMMDSGPSSLQEQREKSATEGMQQQKELSRLNSSEYLTGMMDGREEVNCMGRDFEHARRSDSLGIVEQEGTPNCSLPMQDCIAAVVGGSPSDGRVLKDTSAPSLSLEGMFEKMVGEAVGSMEEKDKLNTLLLEFQDCFADKLKPAGAAFLIPHAIKLKTDDIIYTQQYRQSKV